MSSSFKRYTVIRLFRYGASEFYLMKALTIGNILAPRSEWFKWKVLDQYGWWGSGDFLIGDLEEILQFAKKLAYKVEVYEERIHLRHLQSGGEFQI